MIFLKESLYGWGVCNIPQPRATQDIFADRRASLGGDVAVERRHSEASLGFLALWAALIRRDLPGLQVASVVAVSLFAIILFGLASLYLPAVVEEEPPPLEILAMVMEEPPPVPEPLFKPQPLPVEAPPPVTVPPKPKPRPAKPVVAPPIQPVIPPPTLALAPKSKIESKLPPKVVSLPQKPLKDPVLPGPRTVARQYRATTPVAGPMPAGKPDTDFSRPASELPAVTATHVGNRYDTRVKTASTALPRTSRPRVATGNGTEVDLPSVGGTQRNFKLAHTTQSLRGSGSSKTFIPGEDRPEIALRGISGVGGNSTVGGGQATGPAGLPTHGSRSVGERVGVVGGTEDVDLPVLVGMGKASGSLGGVGEGDDSPSGDGLAAANVSFEGAEDGYDPARMISLNDLNACIDPNAEFPLKTTLATEIDTNGKCAIRAMVFFFKNPENAYTLQVDVFNPENFVDRCDALRTAIQCVNP